MKISKILAGMSAAAIVASMAMIPASAAGTKLNVSDDLLAIGRQSQDDLFAIFFRGDESEGNVVKDGITDITAVYGASFTIKVDNNDWNTIGGGGSINFNDTKNGWNAKDWAGGSWVEDDKPKDTLCYTTDEEGTYVLEYKGDTPLFDAVDDEEKGYAAVGINNCCITLFLIVNCVKEKVLGADGNAIYEAGSNKDKKEVQKKPVAEESSSKTDLTASGTDSKTDSKKDDSKTSSAAATSTAATSSKAGTTSTAATSSAAASDNVAATGATAGIALAGIALAGAAIVVSKRK